MDAALINTKIEYYTNITYRITEDDGSGKVIKLHVGDIVNMDEEIEQVAFARVKAILRHQGNNTNYYAFLVFDWFEAVNEDDSILQCPYYDLQNNGKTQWRQVFPITVVDDMSHNHFVHACTSTCNGCHDITNHHYIRNIFSYNAI